MLRSPSSSALLPATFEATVRNSPPVETRAWLSSSGTHANAADQGLVTDQRERVELRGLVQDVLQPLAQIRIGSSLPTETVLP